MALVLLVHNREESGLAVGGLLLVQAIPRFFGPLAGTIADRVEQRGLMIVCDLLNAAIFAVIAITTPSLPILLALAGASSCVDTLFAPAGRSALPALVDRDELMRANAWLAMSFNLQLAVGPMVGGAIVLALGPSGALGANTGSFLLSAVILGGLPPLRAARDEVGRGFVATGLAGLEFAWETPAIRGLLIGIFFAVAFAAMDNVALVFLVRDTFGGGALAFGALSAAYGAGMVAVSVGLSMRTLAISTAAVFLVGWALSGAGIVLAGLAPTLALVAVGQIIAGSGNGAANIGVETLIQRIVPRPLLGRTFGVAFTTAFAGSSVAYVAAGFLLDVTSPRTVFVIGGTGVLVVVVLFVALLRRHLYEETGADP